MPKEKRPPAKLIWDSPIEDLEEWIETVMNPNKQDAGLVVFDGDIER